MSTRVYVGGINHRARERDVERFFRKFGRIREISLKSGFAFCEFDDYRDADDACYELNGKEFLGERVTVEIAKGTPHGRDKDRWGTGSGGRSRDRSPRRGGRQFTRDSRGRPVWLEKYGPPTRTDYRVIIENLSSRVSWQDLKDYMRQAGDVTYADAHKTRRNEGCVEFANYADLKTALEKLEGTELNGRKIHLIEDKRSKRSRSRSASRSGSRNRSRTKSRSRSKSRGRSRSKSRGLSRSKSRGHSKSESRERSRSKSRGRSRSRDRRTRSRSRSRSSGRRRSRSRSVGERRSKSREKNGTSEKRSASRSRSRSRSRSSFRSRSRSGSMHKDRAEGNEPMDDSRDGDKRSERNGDDD